MVVVVARQFIRPAAGDLLPVPVVLEEEGLKVVVVTVAVVTAVVGSGMENSAAED